MADQQKPQPKNIFELINQNIVDMSQDMVFLAEKVDAIYNALYPVSVPNIPGPEEKKVVGDIKDV